MFTGFSPTKQLIIHVIHPLTIATENLQDLSPACVWALQGHSSDSVAKLWPARSAAHSNGGFSSFMTRALLWTYAEPHTADVACRDCG